MDIVTLGAALNGSKKYTDQVAQSLMGGVHYRGSVSYYDDLPANPAEGDSYTVKYAGSSGSVEDGTEYTWGYDTDTSDYAWISFSKNAYSKAETDVLLGGKQPTIDSTHKLSSDLVNDTNATNKFATAAQLSQIETNKNNILLKANTSDVNTATANLQAQIDQIAQAAGTGTADTEVAQARVGADGTRYTTLKARLDTESKSLYDDLNDVNHYINAVANASGGITYNYDIVEGYVYTVSNNGSGSVTIRCNDDDTSYLIKDNVASGTTFDFTAEHTGKLRIYFFAASSVDVSGGKLKAVEKAVISQSEVIDSNKIVHKTPVYLNYTETGYYVTNGGIGTIVSDEIQESSEVNSVIERVKKGDKFIITGQGGNAPKVWAFTDAEKRIVSVASQNIVANQEIIAPCDGFLYMGFYYTVPHSLHKIDVSFDREIEYTAPTFAVGTLNTASKISRDSEHRYDDIIGYYDMMLYEFNNYMSKEQIGTSQEPEGSFAEIDDSTYPIYVYKYRGRKTADTDENKFILATGLHGDDIGKLGAGDGIEGVSSLAYLIKDILTNPSKNELFEYIRDYCNIIICPVLNPWGYQNGYRHNGRGVDLNRNYSAGFVPNAEEYGCTSGPYAFSEAESAAWSEYIDTNHLDAKFMLEHHTRGGFSGITEQTDNRWNGVYPSGNKTLKNMVKTSGDKMVDRFGGTNDFAEHPAQAIGQAYMYFYSEGMPAIEPEAFRSFGGNPQFTHGSDEVIKQLTVWDNELLSALIELYIR